MLRSFTAVALSTAALLVTSVASRAGDAIVGDCVHDATLRSAMATSQAEGGGTITFSCSGTIAVQSAFQVPGNVTIDGQNKITLSGSNSSRIFEVGGVLTLKDVVVTNGSSSSDGGAIYNQGSLFLQHVKIQDSVSGGSGGAIVTYGTTIVTDSEFTRNKALNGGAIYPRFSGAQVNIQGSTLHNNPATSPTDGLGGAILIWDGASVAILDSDLSGNTARIGGAIHNVFSNSSLSLQDCTVSVNSATAGDAGGVYAAGPLTVTRVTFSDNSATGLGGGLRYNGPATSKITGSTFVHNHAGDRGGGIALRDAAGLTISNSTFYNNFANYGGALANVHSFLSLVNVTMAHNVATSGASGIHNDTLVDGDTTLQNTILGSSNNGANCSSGGKAMISADGNLSDDDSCQGSLTSMHDLNAAAYAPKLGELGPHGGTTFTAVPQPGSPAVDGGVPNSLTKDQRGFSRPLGSANDIGAVEVAPCTGGPAICGDANESGGLTAGDALLALRAAVGAGSCALWLCDWNGSGDLAASDALLIVRKSVGQQVSPSCPPKWDCVAG